MGAIVTEATGLFGVRAFEKQGFKCVSEVTYEDYVDEKWEKILRHLTPHKSIKMMLIYLWLYRVTHNAQTLIN